MAAFFRKFVAAFSLGVAASAAAAAQPDPAPGSGAWVESLKPEWSRPVGGKTRFVGVEEYGRCSVFVDNGAIQVVSPAGDVAWTWPFKSISKYINPSKVAVSHACDAIAFVGDASYKYVWVVDRAGRSASIKVDATPADVEFDRTGTLIAAGTYAGTLLLYSVNGELRWSRPAKVRIVDGLTFDDDNERIRFSNWSGHGVVSLAGHVEASHASDVDAGDETHPSYVEDGRRIAVSEDGSRAWFGGADSIVCVDQSGSRLAEIMGSPTMRGVKVSRDFGQVLIVTEKDLRPVSVERYVVPAPCGG